MSQAELSASHTYIGPAGLMKMACTGTDMTPLSAHLLEMIEADPTANSAEALLDLSTILQLSRNRDIALTLQHQALNLKQLYHLAAPRGNAGIKMLALMTPGDLMTNTPLDFLTEDSDIELDILYVATNLPFPDVIPEHDVLFVAIGESDETRPLLERLGTALQGWPRPVINRAELIPLLSRDQAYTQLNNIKGVVIPSTIRVTRQQLQDITSGATKLHNYLPDARFPIIVRPVGSHAGHGLEKLDDPIELLAYLHSEEAELFYVSRFVNYKDSDGQYRKYRVVVIEGKSYAAHMGISQHWMIHYMNSGMAESAPKRAEEARFFAEFDTDFAVKHADAIQAIYQTMGLEYLVLDCAETQQGELLLFELDNSAVVHTMDPIDLFPYKPLQMRKVFYAFRKLLANSASTTAKV